MTRIIATFRHNWHTGSSTFEESGFQLNSFQTFLFPLNSNPLKADYVKLAPTPYFMQVAYGRRNTAETNKASPACNFRTVGLGRFPLTNILP